MIFGATSLLKTQSLKLKALYVVLLFALTTCGTCSAEIVHAVGRGINERNAIHDAMRAAIEQKFGANVHAKTRVQNFTVIADKISVDSAGLINRCEIVSRRVENGLVVVEIDAELDDAKISARLTEIEKKALVDFNANSPRVAVVAFDSSGQRYATIENEIITALKRQGFTRTVDLAQVNRAVRQRIHSAAGDANLCKTLANDFHADCLVVAEVNLLPDNAVSVASRLIRLNTGEIIFAGMSTGGGLFISGDDSFKLAGRRAANEVALAALKSAAQVERHVTLLITRDTFNQLGGTLTTVCEKIRNLSGVNDAFVRKLNMSLELDIDFDGTAADFAQVLEFAAIKILELGSAYVKI